MHQCESDACLPIVFGFGAFLWGFLRIMTGSIEDTSVHQGSDSSTITLMEEGRNGSNVRTPSSRKIESKRRKRSTCLDEEGRGRVNYTIICMGSIYGTNSRFLLEVHKCNRLLSTILRTFKRPSIARADDDESSTQALLLRTFHGAI